MASDEGVLMLAVTVVLLVVPSLTYEVTLHVKPTSTNTSCPTHPCLTLSEYAQDLEQYFNQSDSNLTLKFLPGNHSLNVNLTISSIHQLEILGNSCVIAPTRITCSSYAGFAFLNVYEMKIDGLVFISCARSHVVHTLYRPYFSATYYGLHLQSVQMAEIIDCSFQDSHGSALGVVDSHVVLRGNNFLNNCRLCSNGRCGAYDYRGPVCYGGGVFIQRSNLSITGNSSFSGNLANDGGGLSAQDSSNVYISGNINFTGNSARRDGGGVSARDSNNVTISGNINFSGNEGIHGSGGGVSADCSTVTISGNAIFSGNSARRDGDGGGVSAKDRGNVKISGNTMFSGNSARYAGGGVCAEDGSNVIISGSTTFSGNSARVSGGGVCAQDSSNVYISGNTTFNGNSASEGNGGGVHADSSNVDISGNTTFSGNSAIYGGGIDAKDNSNMYISGNTTFSNNSASMYGGGVSARDNSNVDISGSTIFSGNTATSSVEATKDDSSNTHISLASGSGGGIYAEERSIVNIIGNTTFSNNSASEYGGGVYARYISTVNISGNTIFMHNSAHGSGGGAYTKYRSNVDVSGTTTFINNLASEYGGGVYAEERSNVYISGGTTFSNNSASRHGGGVSAHHSTVTIIGTTTFSTNSASDGSGGGMSALDRSNVSISGNTTLNGNSARYGNGGGVIALRSNVNISGNATFSGNIAREGGCIFIDSSLNLEGNVSFTNCLATNDGGAIHANGTQVNLIGTNIFIANRAKHLGGGLYAPQSFLNLDGDNTFTENWAGSRGGGIHAQKTEIRFSGTGLLSGNVANLDGGGIYADGSNLNFSANLTIISNTAQLGGGIYSDNNALNIAGPSVFARNVATFYGGGIYTRRSPLILVGNMFIANSAGEGGGIYATANSTLSFDGVNTFMANKAHVSGGGIWLDYSNLTLKGSNYFLKCAASFEGGAIYSYAATTNLTGNNTFESNSATTGGGIHARWSNLNVTNLCDFKHNIAVFGGGIYTNNGTFEFHGSSTFDSNQANYTGGGIYAARSILNFLGTSFITENDAARDGGGIYTRDGSVVNLLGSSNYTNNRAGDTGGGISAFQSTFNLAGQNIFENNTAVEGGGLYTFNSTVNFPGENTFIANSAHNHGGGFTVVHGTLYLNGSTTSKNNSAASGGGMYIGGSNADIDGSNCFMNNLAELEGGAIYAMESVVELIGKVGFVANTATRKGAAIHVYSSNLILKGSSSFVNNWAECGGAIQATSTTLTIQGITCFINNWANDGGGIHTESSNLTFAHHQSSQHARSSSSYIECNICSSVFNSSSILGITFVNNTALWRGGAQYFDVTSTFSLHQPTHVHFKNNSATEFGGAIYVEDVPSRSDCFLHIQNDKSLYVETTSIVFDKNTAGIRGSVLYGGLLDKCPSALQLFNMSILQGNDDKASSISSDPTQLCFCNKSEWNCKEATQSRRSIYPGQQIEVSVVAIDQSNSAVPALIHTTVHSGHNLTVSETISYETGENCTSRNHSVTPKNLFNQLELYPSTKSGNTIHLIVNITFESCPIGFEPSNSTGECICDHRLWQYTNSCNIDRQAILRNSSSTFWLNILYNSGTPEGFIHHPFCPLDYCTAESKYINLNDPDKQCNVNRSGLLCGKCKEGLSLVLGSSECKECSNNYLALLIPFALAGVLLVILLFLLNLTVAAGTLHGLIFYANIVAANHHIFFPQSSNNPAVIFIAWLNLDLGIQTCFYDGMDSYAKMWLELVFPVYIWVIVGFLVYISSHSVVVTKLLGSRPVSVLATLFLLSYAKVLRTIIAALSLTVLHYPHKNVVVWVHDANVSLAKYIPLALVALFSLVFLFIPYTLLLLLGQWLQTKSDLRLLTWINSPKLRAILDAYRAQYEGKHQYWTGLLLLVRCALFLVFAFSISGNDGLNLLVVSPTAFGIFIWFALSGRVYKRWCLNALELSFIFNLGMLAVATIYVKLSGGSQTAVACTSVGVAFLSFLVIVTYHTYIQIKSKVQYTQCGHQLQYIKEKFKGNWKDTRNLGNLEHPCVVTPNNNATCTEVDLRELRSPLDLLDTK